MSISTFVTRHAGLTVSSGARTGAVTLIHRFGFTLNLNIHLHMLFLGGAFPGQGKRPGACWSIAKNASSTVTGNPVATARLISYWSRWISWPAWPPGSLERSRLYLDLPLIKAPAQERAIHSVCLGA
jgi:hypothetical protein